MIVGTRTRRLVLSLGMLAFAAGCSVASDTTESTQSQQSDVREVSTTEDTAEAALSTTSSVGPETTTTAPVGDDVLFVGLFENAAGWQYEIEAVFNGSSIDGSPGGCIPIAPPGQLNATFVVAVTNAISDRPSPYPPMQFKSNVMREGAVVQDGALFGNLGSRSFDAVEVFPNEAARLALCGLDATAVAAGLGEIEAEGSVEFNVTVGPVEQDDIESLELGIRFFKEQGSWVDAFMTTVPDSGTWVLPNP